MVAVLAQVRSELRSWDGLVSDSEGVRHSQVEILLETIGRRSKLSLLAPRREGFPEVFSSGPVQMTGGDSWYDPLDLNPVDGTLLKEGFSWTSENQTNVSFVVHPEWYSHLLPIRIIRDWFPGWNYQKVSCARYYVMSPADRRCLIFGDRLRFGATSISRNICAERLVSFSECSRDSAFGRLPVELRGLDVASEMNIVPLGGLRVGSNGLG